MRQPAGAIVHGTRAKRLGADVRRAWPVLGLGLGVATLSDPQYLARLPRAALGDGRARHRHGTRAGEPSRRPHWRYWGKSGWSSQTGCQVAVCQPDTGLRRATRATCGRRKSTLHEFSAASESSKLARSLHAPLNMEDVHESTEQFLERCAAVLQKAKRLSRSLAVELERNLGFEDAVERSRESDRRNDNGGPSFA